LTDSSGKRSAMKQAEQNFHAVRKLGFLEKPGFFKQDSVLAFGRIYKIAFHLHSNGMQFFRKMMINQNIIYNYINRLKK